MTPTPPSSPDGSPVPPRHRPPLGNLAKDTTEMDLWAFDDLDPLDELPPVEAPLISAKLIPEPRDADLSDSGNAGKFSRLAANKSNSTADSVSVNINKDVNKDVKRARFPNATAGTGTASSHANVGGDFDDLDSWDEPTQVVATPPRIQEMPVAREAVTANEPPLAADLTLPIAEDDKEEFSNKPHAIAEPIPLAPRLNLSRVERAGLGVLAALILISGGFFYFNTINRIPAPIEPTSAKDFPISGNKLTIVSAVTYWREPITTGENADKVRRDTVLVPVVELASSGGPAAVRVFFRDSNGELIGDAVSRAAQGEMKFTILATAGFDDFGLHAAYRTGQTEPWTIEVLEAPSENSPPGDFKKIFEMNISADRR